MKVLVLNSYAGSLTLGATALGANIIGSYEDSNFGLDIQKHNLPGLNYLSFRHQWPKQDLSDVVVIAHPPCSAFSVQNCSPTARGANSEAFACTKHVLQYACSNGAKAIAIESVMGALGGAYWQHQQYADDYGYNLYRIVENGIHFGCQWRERFWVLYIKKGVAPDNITLTLTPRFQTVSQVIDEHTDGPSAGNQEKLLVDQKERLRTEAGLTDAEMSYLFEVQDPPHKTKALGNVLFDYKYRTNESTGQDRWDMFQKFIGGFASGTMVYLDPNGFTPVVMGGSFWYYNGRCLSENAFKRIMGFPADYVFPESPRNYRTQIRMYLSKGVMPPRAEWILEQTFVHLGTYDNPARPLKHTAGPNSYVVEVQPNDIADFRIRKDEWWTRDEKLPTLRHYDHMRPSSKAFTIAEEELNSDQRQTFKDAKSIFEYIKQTGVTELGPEGAWNIDTMINRIELTLNPPEAEEKPKTVKEPKPAKERAPRPERPERPTTLKMTRMLGQYIRAGQFVMAEQFESLTIKKRHQLYVMIREKGIITLEDAIVAGAAALNILETTTRWHIRQMVAAGQVLEATASEIAAGRPDSLPVEEVLPLPVVKYPAAGDEPVPAT